MWKSLFGSSTVNYSNELAPGTVIIINQQNIKIVAKLGEGAFATVYSATDKSNKKYAVKHCKCVSDEQMQLVDSEILYMNMLCTSNHSNVIHFHGVSAKHFEATEEMNKRKEYYFLMEFMQFSLIDLLKEKQTTKEPLSEKHLWRMFIQICNGVAHIHQIKPHPIAHRDLKIDNILMSIRPPTTAKSKASSKNNNGNHSPLYTKADLKSINCAELQLKICDFGSCVDGNPRVCTDVRSINIEQEMIDRFTTPSYRSPEMIDLYQRKELSTKVDIWALGCILYLLAFLKHPFPEGNKMQILGIKYAFPATHSFSKKVTKLIKMCFHSDPVRRPTAQQMVEHISDILRGGKGTLKTSKGKRSRSVSGKISTTQTLKNQLHLPNAAQNQSSNRRHSEQIPVALQHTLNNNNNDSVDEWAVNDDWDPFADDAHAHAHNNNQRAVASAPSVNVPMSAITEEDADADVKAVQGGGGVIEDERVSLELDDDQIIVDPNTVVSADFAAAFFGDSNVAAKAASNSNKGSASKRKPKTKRVAKTQSSVQKPSPSPAREQSSKPKAVRAKQKKVKPKQMKGNPDPKPKQKQETHVDQTRVVDDREARAAPAKPAPAPAPAPPAPTLPQNKRANMRPKRKKSGIPLKPIDQLVYDNHNGNGHHDRDRDRDSNHSDIIGNGGGVHERERHPKQAMISDSKTQATESKHVMAVDPKVLYSDQLAQLTSMGLTNVPKNINALSRGDGNVQIALNILLQ